MAANGPGASPQPGPGHLTSDKGFRKFKQAGLALRLLE
jgi:hypothetical protein